MKDLKDYNDYMDGISADEELREAITLRANSPSRRVSFAPVYALAAALAIVLGIGAYVFWNRGDSDLAPAADSSPRSAFERPENCGGRTSIPPENPAETRSFVPTNMPTDAHGCDAPDFCVCSACKAEPPTNLTWEQLNTVRDIVMPILDEYGFPITGGSVYEWGELNHRVTIEFLRNDAEMLTLRPQIEAVVSQFLESSDHPLAARMDMNGFAFIGTGAPMLVPVGERPLPQNDIPQMIVTDVTPSGLTYRWQNDTGREFIYGASYRLYIREGDYWLHLNSGEPFFSIGYGMANPETEPREQHFGRLFDNGVMQPGEYRFVKDFIFLRRPGDFDDYEAEYRFTVD
jgi:hypothetical protein